MTEVLLKARPTRAQLADRLSAPLASGLELYLDPRDVDDPGRLERLAHRLVEVRPSPDFVYVVEGPLRSLDGSFFDISVCTEAQLECVRRVSWLAAEIGAEAVLVHAIAPRKLRVRPSEELHRSTLEAGLPFVRSYVELVQARGLVPLLENIPPVARQREAAYMWTPVGMRAGDLIFFARRFPGLGAVVDVSHAQLFLNGLAAGGRGSGDGGQGEGEGVPGVLEPLLEYLSTLGDEPTMEGYLAELEPYLYEAHISNARGILEEGLPYSDGDLDLDALAVRLSRSARHLVTEVIEPDPDRGVNMREAQTRLEAALGMRSGRG
jgi:hypothetical protein